MEEWFLSLPCPTELALPSRLKLGNSAQMFVANSQVASLTGCDFQRMSHSAEQVQSLPSHTANTVSGAGRSASANTRPGGMADKGDPLVTDCFS